MAGVGSGWFGRRSTKMRTDEYQAIDVRRMARQSCLREDVLLAGGALVRLEWRPCHFGGYRSNFWCPRCGGRCCILHRYQVEGRSTTHYGCQKCLRMVHSVENEGKLERAMRRSDKAFSRQSYDPSRPEGKPLWMRWNTWRRLSKEIAATAMARIEYHDNLIMLIRHSDEKQPEGKTIATE